MKPPERLSPDDPREWLNRARSNLALAKNRVPDVYLEDLCFEAQQAAEKAIKALMIRREIEYPYMHDLAHLVSDVSLPSEATSCNSRSDARQGRTRSASGACMRT